jgi:excisionase family DNA binding protein
MPDSTPGRRPPRTSEGPYDDLVTGLAEALVGVFQRAVTDALPGLVRQAVADAVSDLTTTTQPDTAVAVSVAEAARRLGLGLTTVKSLVTSGQIRSVTVDRRRLIPVQAIGDYVRRLEENAAPLRALAGQGHRGGSPRRSARRTELLKPLTLGWPGECWKHSPAVADP